MRDVPMERWPMSPYNLVQTSLRLDIDRMQQRLNATGVGRYDSLVRRPVARAVGWASTDSSPAL
jgi:hypothetical protein